MSDWAIPVGGAAIGAMATIVAAYLSYAKERKNERASILQDRDIVQKLPDESRAKEALQSYIENRAVLLPLERRFRAMSFGLLGAAAVVLVGTIASKLSEVTGLPIESYWWWAIAVLFLPGSVYVWMYRHEREKLIKRFVSELSLPSDVVEPIADRLGKSNVTWRFWKRGNR